MTRKKISLYITALLCLCLTLSGCGESETHAAVSFAAAEVAPETTELSIVLQEGEAELLSQLTMLESADLSGSACLEEIYGWAEANPQVDVTYTVTLPDGTVLDNSAKSADLSKMSGSEIRSAAGSLRFLPKLRSIQLGAERANLSWDDIEALCNSCPGVELKYRFSLYGKEMDLANTQINLSHIPVDDGGAAVMQAMACMSNLTYLDMDSCGVSNEEMAAIRDAYPHVKVVWRIWFGATNTYSVRTDVERILASKPSVAGFVDEVNGEALKYCTEVRYLDLGHNALLGDISFVEYMPRLEVLILAMAKWSDATPLAGCTELEYLEMQTTECTDLSPLSGLTKLRHLNIACIPALNDISPLYSLTGLERLWLGSNNSVPWEQVEEMQKAAPNCEINTGVYDDPTGEGWRFKGETQAYRYYILRKQFDGYEHTSFSFTWNDPLY